MLLDILNPFVCPMCYFIDALLQLTLCSFHRFCSESDTEVVNIKITTNSRSKTPCNTANFYIKQCHWQNTPSSCLQRLENVDPIRTRNCRSERKLFMKFGNLPRSPRLWWSFIIPNLQVVSFAFSRSKKTAIRSCFWILLSLIEVSNLTTWSIVDCRFRKLHWELVISLLDSRYQTSLLFTIRSIVLHRQLVSAIGR